MKVFFPTEYLLEAPDYRQFLNVLYVENKKIDRGFSFSFIAKRCQLASKGFVCDVIQCRKDLSIESVRKLTDGLKFSTNWKNYFTHLFYLSTKGDAPKGAHLKELDRVRAKLRSAKVKDRQESIREHLFQFIQWPVVYAALGTPGKGATLENVVSRTRMGGEQVKVILDKLIEEGLASREGTVYRCLDNSFVLEDLGKNLFFKKFFQKNLQDYYQKTENDFASKADTYYSVSLSLQKDRMPEFKKSLVELLDKFTTDCEDPEGDRIANVTCCMSLV